MDLSTEEVFEMTIADVIMNAHRTERAAALRAACERYVVREEYYPTMTVYYFADGSSVGAPKESND